MTDAQPLARLRELAADIEDRIGGWPGESVIPALDDRTFDILARDVYRAQRAVSPVLDRFWGAAVGVDLGHWTEIPPIPTTAFRAVPMGESIPAEAVFRTSGTSAADQAPGLHRVLSLSLYHAAARGNYRRSLLSGGDSFHLVGLVPEPAAASGSTAGATTTSPPIEPPSASG